jgi:hypothetical protein
VSNVLPPENNLSPVIPDAPPAPPVESAKPIELKPVEPPREIPSTPPVAKEASPAVSIEVSRVLGGTVSLVNERAGLCVVTFPIGRLPALQSVMKVYRRGVTVGEIQITGPQRDDNIAADILSGELRNGDEARDR